VGIRALHQTDQKRFLILCVFLPVLWLLPNTLPAQDIPRSDSPGLNNVTGLPEFPRQKVSDPPGTKLFFFRPQPYTGPVFVFGVPTLPPSPLDGPRRITLEEAQQQAAQTSNPMVHLAQLGVEAAKQHRLGAQSDYFPKLSSTFSNMHFNKFMGSEITITRPIAGSTVTAGLPLAGKDQTLVAVTATQPITPLFKLHEVVNLARADENIARAKAGMPVAEVASAVEKNYYDLLVAERQETLAQLSVKKLGNKRMVASNAPVAPDGEELTLEAGVAEKALIEASSKVRELAASLNDLLGWPAETRLELVEPGPLVETISLKEATDEAATTNPEVIEAEQNVAKARAGAKLAKLDYIPDVAVMGGYVYNNNALPLLPIDFSFVGIVASYNIFDFGKREHTIKERNTQVEMAEAALALTKAKVGSAVKSSYFELERSRQLSELAQRLESGIRTIDAKYLADDPDAAAARTKLELEALEADRQHREAYIRLKSLLGER
jgi:outer membrane protein TolC